MVHWWDLLEHGGKTLAAQRPQWTVFSGECGDVTRVKWSQYKGRVDVLHGGTPCQPFSTAGHQLGSADARDMWPTLVSAVLAVSPLAFVAENVPALGSAKFSDYVETAIHKPLADKYRIRRFELRAQRFGVPQVRRRLFFVGFRSKKSADAFVVPEGDFRLEDESDTLDAQVRVCMGARAALGLHDIGFDALGPTIRSGLTGPHHTTCILNSSGSQAKWRKLGIWPSGVAPDHERASLLPTKTGDYRMCLEEVALLQGFPASWRFSGPLYSALGQIGNAVPPPVAYAVGAAVRDALKH
ncbi:MAG: DNA-methyltransferase Dcm [Ilumatobacteraceae bacterium]|nr:DNA-methyltransferase Dcm [Ilumatobacteraceae bacterium]